MTVGNYMGWRINIEGNEADGFNCQISYQESGGMYRQGTEPIVYDMGVLKHEQPVCMAMCKLIIRKIKEISFSAPIQAIAEVTSIINAPEQESEEK